MNDMATSNFETNTVHTMETLPSLGSEASSQSTSHPNLSMDFWVQ